jgi:pyridoxamine 5'-phosphate oxidase
MDKKEIFDFLNKTVTCYIASVEGNVPHVRALGLAGADEHGIVFQSWKIKAIYPQLCKNPNVEICCYNPKKPGIQIRISGKIEPVEDREAIKKIVDKRPYLTRWLNEMDKGWEVLFIFVIKHGLAMVWTRATNLTAKEFVQL